MPSKIIFLTIFSEIIQFNLKIFNTIAVFDLIRQFVSHALKSSLEPRLEYNILYDVLLGFYIFLKHFPP